MLLALMRHGVAEDAGPDTGHRDEPRRLTEEGARRMRAAAAGMGVLGLAPGLIVTSPLARCVQTAEIVAGALGAEVAADRRLAPGMTLEGLVELLQVHGWADELMLCGHQPDMSRAIADLTGGGEADMKKGAVALLELDAPRRDGGRLVALYPPRALRALGGDGGS